MRLVAANYPSILNMPFLSSLRCAAFVFAFPVLLTGGSASATEPPPCVEDFADVDRLPAQGWSIANLSDPVGVTTWEQGLASVFSSYEGAPDAYAAADLAATQGSPATISLWLITPMIDFGPNSISARALDLYARALPGAANRLVVRQCLTSASEDCNAPASGIGGFTTALIEINRDLLVDGFPLTWTHFIATPADGLATVGVGRIAFHYSIPSQPDGSHGTYIGPDSVMMTGATTCPFGENVFENGFD